MVGIKIITLYFILYETIYDRIIYVENGCLNNEFKMAATLNCYITECSIGRHYVCNTTFGKQIAQIFKLKSRIKFIHHTFFRFEFIIFNFLLLSEWFVETGRYQAFG